MESYPYNSDFKKYVYAVNIYCAEEGDKGNWFWFSCYCGMSESYEQAVTDARDYINTLRKGYRGEFQVYVKIAG